MAFMSSEINLILRVQDRASTRLRRIASDVGGINNAANRANAVPVGTRNQQAQSARIISLGNEHRAQLEKSAALERRLLEAQNTFRATQYREQEAFDKRRLANARQITTAERQLDSKRRQIGLTEQSIARQGSGSSAIRQEIAMSTLAAKPRLLGIERAGLLDKELLIQQNISAATATQIGLVHKLQEEYGSELSIQGLIEAGINDSSVAMQQLGHRLQSNVTLMGRLETQTAEMPAKVEAWQAKLAGVNEEELLILAKIDEQAQAVINLNSGLQLQLRELEGIEAKLAQVKNEWKLIAAQENVASAAAQKELRRLEGMAAALAIAKDEAVGLAAALNIARDQGMRLATTADNIAEAETRSARMSRIGRGVRHAGSFAAMGGALGIGVSAGLAGQYASFNREATRAATQLRAPGESVGVAAKAGKDLEQTIRGLSRTFPASMTEMANSAYELASGIDLVDSKGKALTSSHLRLIATTNLLAVANRAAVAGNVDLATATDSMLLVLNNFGKGDLSVRHVNSIMNTLFATVKYGKGTFAEFAPVFGRMATAANTAGQSLAEAGGAVAFLSTRMSQSQAVTAYVRLLQIMQRPEFVAGFKQMFGTDIGRMATVSVNGVRKHVEQLKPLWEIIDTIVTRKPKLTAGGIELANLIPNITGIGQGLLAGKGQEKGLQSTQYTRVALQNLVQGWKTYRNILSEVTGNQDEFNKSYKLMSDSPGVRWQVAINQFKAFAIIIGQQVLPGVLKFFDFIGKLAHRFESLSPHTKHLVGQFLIFGSILSLGVGLLGMFSGAILSLVSVFGKLGKTLGGGEAGVVGRVAVLSRLIKGFAALTLIKIVFDISKKGNVSWSQMASLALGAGIIGGPIAGAAVGGLLLGAKLGVLAHDKIFGAPDRRSALQKQIADNKAAMRTFRGAGTLIPETNPAAPVRPGFAGRLGAAATRTAAELRAAQLSLASSSTKGLFGPQGLNKMKADVAHVVKLEHTVGVTFKKMNKDTIGVWQAGRLVEEFRRGSAGFTLLSKGAGEADKASKNAARSIYQKWADLATELSGIQYFAGFNQQAIQAISNTELLIKEATLAGNTGLATKLSQGELGDIEKQINKLKKIPLNKMTPQQKSQLGDLLVKANSINDSLTTSTDKAAAATARHEHAVARAQRAQERHTEALQKAAERITNAKNRIAELTLKLQGLKQASLDAIQSTFGGAGQGPIMSGPIGSMYTQINTMLAGFGAKPIPIPISLLLKDQAAQQGNLDVFTRLMDRVAKKIPKGKLRNEFVKEMLAQGVDAIPKLETIAKHPGQWIKNFIKLQSTIKETSEKPWAVQLQASNIQYKAALLQLKAAGGKLTKAEEHWLKVNRELVKTVTGAVKPKPTTKPKPPPTTGHGGTGGHGGKTASFKTPGDTVIINAHGVDPKSLAMAYRHGMFKTKRRT